MTAVNSKIGDMESNASPTMVAVNSTEQDFNPNKACGMFWTFVIGVIIMVVGLLKVLAAMN